MKKIAVTVVCYETIATEGFQLVKQNPKIKIEARFTQSDIGHGYGTVSTYEMFGCVVVPTRS